jgi:hypothetical protein
MARSDAYFGVIQSPVKKYLSWSSNEKCFTYWDKEAKETKKLSLPVKFIHYDEFATIKGWHEPSKSGIFSNEVKSTKTEKLVVRTFNNKILADGLYQDIKPSVNSAGGDYHVSLYAELNGEIINISLKGAALGTWSNFSKDHRKFFLGSYINVIGAQDEKKGSVKYSVPVFQVGDKIEAEVSASSDKNYDELVSYFKARKASGNSTADEVSAPQPEPIMPPAQESFIPAFDEPADSSELPF